MQFLSTRGGMEPRTYTEALLEGLAPDGGLAVPDELPRLTREALESWRSLSYAELATEVIALFATDIPHADLARLCAAAYSAETFRSPVPLTPIDEHLTLVGLSEGPTLAFKDMAMQFLGEVLEYVLEKTDSVINILGATSGDTGSAAEYALRGKDRVAVFMLSPQGRMSAFQRAQMFSLDDENIHNIAIDGVFDDCQDLVKALSGDLAFKKEHHLGAVNSINLARITAQIVYYFWAWLRASDALDETQRASFAVSFAVPTGNFGNILSGHYARRMGLPVERLVLATNENNVLEEFFRTGVYRPRSAADTPATSSPSMDISKASNLERFIYDLLGRDPERVITAWTELSTTGAFDLSVELDRFTAEFGFAGGQSLHADRLDTIREVYRTAGIVIDPHTADGVAVARNYADDGVPMLVLETAKPEKFGDTIKEAIGIDLEFSPELRTMLAAPQHVTELPLDEQRLRDFLASRTLR